MTSQAFPAKVLLFGEYTVLHGGAALAMPFEKFSGHWKKGTEETELFWGWLQFLKEHQNQILRALNLSKLREDLNEGWSYQANIPIGQGLGSSAALSASVYARYGEGNAADFSMLQIQNDLAVLESFFHGKSSGFDPLISFLGKSVLRNKDKTLQEVVIKGQLQNVYVILSNKIRTTGELVEDYQRRLQDAIFFDKMKEMGDLADDVIQAFLKGTDYWSQLQDISTIQHDYLGHLIPEPLLPIWEGGLKKEKFMFKLCGAGGGGSFLMFAKDEIPSLPQGYRLLNLL